MLITSPQNPRIKQALLLRKRSRRDEQKLLLVEGYRELRRAVTSGWYPHTLFFCRPLFLGGNEDALLDRCAAGGSELMECGEPAFRKIAYRDRPDGLVAVGPQVRRQLKDLTLPPQPFLLVAEAIEKPGNLGTILRTCDAAGVDAVILCDRCTDLYNPNVVRASIGALFTVPIAEASSVDTIAWLKQRGVRCLAASPAGSAVYSDVDLTGSLALVVGSEQYGLRETWLRAAEPLVRIPMHGKIDSLNVAAAATILLFEAVRQRHA